MHFYYFIVKQFRFLEPLTKATHFIVHIKSYKMISDQNMQGNDYFSSKQKRMAFQTNFHLQISSQLIGLIMTDFIICDYPLQPSKVLF